MMSNFKNFVLKINNNKELIDKRPSTDLIASSIMNELAATSFIGLSSSEKGRFSSEVARLASSNEVLTELSDSLGRPREDESENEFVERAKTTFASILRYKLMK